MPEWTSEGLCSQTDPAEFFPDRGGSVLAAKKICAACGVRAECLEYALANNERFGIWGGTSERERRRLQDGEQPAPAQLPRDYTEVDRLLLEGVHTDVAIGHMCNIPKSTVHRRREQLNLKPASQRRNPLAVYAELSRATEDGHREWTGSTHTVIGGRHYRPARLAFLAGHGREPEGHVRPTCGLRSCVASAHLADRVMRTGQAAA